MSVAAVGTKKCVTGLICKNGGVCFVTKSDEEFCECTSDYLGDNCQFYIGIVILFNVHSCD